jgi:hypothetical protein
LFDCALQESSSRLLRAVLKTISRNEQCKWVTATEVSNAYGREVVESVLRQLAAPAALAAHSAAERGTTSTTTTAGGVGGEGGRNEPRAAVLLPPPLVPDVVLAPVDSLQLIGEYYFPFRNLIN